MSDNGFISPEKEVARRLLANVENLGKNYEGLVAEVNKIQGDLKRFDGFDPATIDIKSAIAEFEKTKAVVEQMKADRRRASSGSRIPGLSAEAKNFSMIRAMTAIKSGDWTRAGFEREVFDAARTKAQAMGLDSAGGYFIPDEVIEDVIAAIYTQSALINLSGDGTTRVSVLDGLTGGTVKVPKFLGGVVAYWIGESDEYAESQTKVGDMMMNPKKLGVLVRMTQEMRTYASYGFESLLRTDMIRAAAKVLDRSILYGSGTAHAPRGVVNAVNAANLAKGDLKASPSVQVYDANGKTAWNGAAITTNESYDDAALDFDGMDNMMALLEDNDVVADNSAAFLAHPKFFRSVKALKVDNYTGQNTNKPYLLGAPRLPDSRLADIIGGFAKSTQIATNNKAGQSVGWTGSSTTGHTDVFYGNWNEVVLGRWGGIEIEDDGGRGKGFTSDQTYMKMRLYVDVGFRHEQSIVVCPNAKL